jgi:hypothetical protein
MAKTVKTPKAGARKPMPQSQVRMIKGLISSSLTANASISPVRVNKFFSFKKAAIQGKLYEAFVLADVIEKLTKIEGCAVRLMKSSKLRMKQKGGWINRAYPHFEVSKNGIIIGEIWNDIYFSTLSHSKNGTSPISNRGNYHELDIAFLKCNVGKYPRYSDVLIAIECKNISLQKSTVREILGFRRELSYLNGPTPTDFDKWPETTVKADPNSVHLFYCTDPFTTHYHINCIEFGTTVNYLPMP